MVTSLEAVVAKGGNEIIAFICNLVYILPFYIRFFGPVIEMYSICRDYKHHQLPVMIVGTTTLCICAFVFTAARCYKPLLIRYRQLSVFLRASTELPLMAVSVVIFFHIYGKREYSMDLYALYPEDGKHSKLTNPLTSIQFFSYDVMPFLFCVSCAATEFFAIVEASKFATHSDVDRGFKNALILTPILIILSLFFTSFYKLARINELSKLFSITPQHPSYNRVNYIELFEMNDDKIVADTLKLPTVLTKHDDTASTKTAPTMDETEVQRVRNANQTTTGMKSTDRSNTERILSRTKSRKVRATSSATNQADESKRKVKMDGERGSRITRIQKTKGKNT
ncbi:hypothetical protein DICVIV_02990 [Dictyocaulus viviparus]|uniref:Uncharacterized protein n=1 Tax=Dictyocaulus viviparus TaxID=29172 RepID=A0A0D8Y2B2_DICVI|nr:hypothetical protein DICVIV_02990 [Dictyocaulus viviparus]